MKYVITSILALAISFAHAADDRKAIEERIKPVGQVTTLNQVADNASAPAAGTTPAAAAAAPAAPQSGEKIFQTYCTTCHTAGVAGAPKFGDKAAWAPRIQQGEATLLKHALEGLRAMPPKGTCMQCTETEIKAAISYMVDKAK